MGEKFVVFDESVGFLYKTDNVMLNVPGCITQSNVTLLAPFSARLTYLFILFILQPTCTVNSAGPLKNEQHEQKRLILVEII